MLASFATILAGLGLFFAGLSFLTENLKKLEGRRLSDALVIGIGKPWRAFVWGIIVGGLTHTATITVFVLTGLLAAGLTTIKSSLPVLLGVNIGTSALVFLATLDVDTIVLIVTGVAGMAIASEKAAALQSVIKAVFGIGMLFVGIIMIQDGSTGIVEQPWIQQYLSENRESFFIAFFAGAVLRVIAQSASAVTIFAISLTSTGAFGVEQTIMAIYGANFGAAISTWILSAGVRGHSRKIAIFQVLFDALGTLVLVPLFYIELYSGLPLMKSLVISIAEDVQQQMAFVFLFFNMIAALSLVIMLSLTSLATRWWNDAGSHLNAGHMRVEKAIVGPSATAHRLRKTELTQIDRRTMRTAAFIGLFVLSCCALLFGLHDTMKTTPADESVERTFDRENRLERVNSLQRELYQSREPELSTQYTLILEDDIRDLLRQAEAHIVAHRFTSPPENNAWERYEAVLTLDPDNYHARHGLMTLIERYIQLANSAEVADRNADAEFYLGKARTVLFGYTEDAP